MDELEQILELELMNDHHTAKIKLLERTLVDRDLQIGKLITEKLKAESKLLKCEEKFEKLERLSLLKTFAALQIDDLLNILINQRKNSNDPTERETLSTWIKAMTVIRGEI